MRLNSLALLAVTALATASCGPQAPAEANGPARFQAHDVADFGGYAVTVADMNNDGRPDLICTGSGGKIRWYENLGQ